MATVTIVNRSSMILAISAFSVSFTVALPGISDKLPDMMDAEVVDREIIAYRLKLTALAARFERGERSTVGEEASKLSDSLLCLMEEAPMQKRRKIDYLIDRYEALRASCLS